MATLQQLTDAIALLDTSVQAQTTQSSATKTATDLLVTNYQLTKDKVDNDLNNVSNTADSDKPLSLADIAALLLKLNISDLATINGNPLNTGLALVIERSPTSLTSLPYADIGSLRTPIAPLPIADDAVTINGLGMFMYVSTTDEPDDDETCFTAVDPSSGLPIGQWLLRLPAYEWTSAHNLIRNSIMREWMDDEQTRISNY